MEVWFWLQNWDTDKIYIYILILGAHKTLFKWNLDWDVIRSVQLIWVIGTWLPSTKLTHKKRLVIVVMRLSHMSIGLRWVAVIRRTTNSGEKSVVIVSQVCWLGIGYRKYTFIVGELRMSACAVDIGFFIELDSDVWLLWQGFIVLQGEFIINKFIM